MMQMIQNSFQYAKNQQIIISNPAPLAIEICKKEKKITKPPTKKNAFTLNELMNLLLTARKMDYTFYLFLLLSASTGARVSETRAICFSKIDFQKKQLLIDCQLGRGYDNEGFDDNTLLSQKRTLKTRNSKRYVPLPDFIMDELYLARARYEETLKNDPEFDEKSVEVSKKLAEEYHKVALLHHAAFLDASAFASPSTTDREHLDAAGHAALANAIYEKVIDMQKELEKAV